MTNAKARRRRGVFLTDGGLRRIHDAVRCIGTQSNARISLESLSASTGVSTRSLSRALNRASPIDFRTLEALFSALNIAPTDADYYQAGRSIGRPPLRMVPEQLTRLVGRDGVLKVLDQLLRASRLLTLTGMGGIGKTRLAIELSRRRQEMKDLVCFIELTPGADVAECIEQISSALGLRVNPAGLQDGFELHDDSALLVLDNCDNVAFELGAFITRLLRASPALRILATSRETLEIEGECVFRVPTLPTPEPDVPISANRAMDYSAVALFVERARARNPDFNLTNASAKAIVEIATCLDGLPLAIEFAAVRAGEMSPEDLRSYLRQHLNDLESRGASLDPRHRSMRALMDWSFARLSEHEQLVYSRASVFCGPFDATGLTAVCSDLLPPESTLAVAYQLARKSLLEISVQRTPTVFSMMRTAREYARARLEEDSYPHLSHWNHALYILKVTTDLMRPVREEGRTEHLARLALSFSDVRSALIWTFTSNNEHIGAALVAQLPEYWESRGEYRAGEQWIRRALSVGSEYMTEDTSALLQEGLALVLHRQVRFEEAAKAAHQSAEIYKQLHDDVSVCRAQNLLGIIDYDAGDMERARMRFTDNLRRGSGLNRRVAAAGLLNLGRIERDFDGNPRRSIERFEQSLKISREMGRQNVVALSLAELGHTYAMLGNLFRATDVTKQGMAAFLDLGNEPWYARQAWNVALYRIRSVGFTEALSEVKTALVALQRDPYRSELYEQLALISELLLDDAKAEHAATLLLVSRAHQSSRRPVDAKAARLNDDLLQRSRHILGSETLNDIAEKASELSIEEAIRAALVTPYEDCGANEEAMTTATPLGLGDDMEKFDGLERNATMFFDDMDPEAFIRGRMITG